MKTIIYRYICILYIVFASSVMAQNYLLIPMDPGQTNHLKAYGLAYQALSNSVSIEWLLGYRGGSFLLPYSETLMTEAALRGISYEILNPADAVELDQVLQGETMERVRLDKAPRIAVYTPPNKLPWDDAVTLALTYAQIPYTPLYDADVIAGKLKDFEWLHLHHEDFTGQLSKFYRAFAHTSWYREQQAGQWELAKSLGFSDPVKLKKAVALAIRDYVEQGGFLFAMCLAGTTLDMALATARTDVSASVFDGTPIDPNWKSKLDYSLCMAFTGFSIDTDPMSSSHGDLDYNQVNAGSLEKRPALPAILMEFSPKFDPVPTMLTQNHTSVIPGFFGLATSFGKEKVKKSVTILAEVDGQNAVKYLHGNLGKGQFSILGGHDPEDKSHAVGDAPTDLNLHKSSPGYRLILNNVLYPAARKKKQKT